MVEGAIGWGGRVGRAIGEGVGWNPASNSEEGGRNRSVARGEDSSGEGVDARSSHPAGFDNQYQSSGRGPNLAGRRAGD